MNFEELMKSSEKSQTHPQNTHHNYHAPYNPHTFNSGYNHQQNMQYPAQNRQWSHNPYVGYNHHHYNSQPQRPNFHQPANPNYANFTLQN